MMNINQKFQPHINLATGGKIDETEIRSFLDSDISRCIDGTTF